MFGALWYDLRYGLRTMLKHRAVTAVVLLSVMIGVGCNSVVFSLVNSIVLRPLPYKEPERIVQIVGTLPRQGRDDTSVSYPDFTDWRANNQTCEEMAAYNAEQFRSFVLTGGDEPRRVFGAAVSAGLFPLLGVNAAAGRTFLPGEDAPGAEPVALVGNGLWQRQFNSDPALIGRSITLDGQSFRVVGIMPADFQFPIQSERIEVWVPTNVDAAYLAQRGIQYLGVLARLKPGVTPEQAQADLGLVARQLEQQYPNSNSGRGVRLIPLHERIVGNVRQSLLLLFGAVGLVLLIACANVANLLLVRAAARRQEFALRAALGASRWRMARQLFTESLLLGVTGGALGVLLAFVAVRVIVSAGLENIPRAAEIGLDGRVLAFTALASILTGLVFGLAPVLGTFRVNPNDAIKEQGRSATVGARQARIHNLLVILEVALSLILLIQSGLIIKSFLRLTNTNPGFNTENLLVVPFILPEGKYPEPERKAAFYQNVLQRVEALPGVQSAAAVTPLPLSKDAVSISFEVEGRPPAFAGEKLFAEYRSVSHDYFGTMGIPILSGRDFTEHDAAGGAGVLVINENMARAYWPGADPVGRRVKLRGPKRPWLTVVGVVGAVKYSGLHAEPEPEIYAPYLQDPLSFMTVVMRTNVGPSVLAAPLRREIKAIDPDQPAPPVETMNAVVSKSVAQPRFNAVLFGLFSAVALILAAIGVYGVVSFSVAQRMHELGVRVALGARPNQILVLVMKRVLITTLLGLAVGIASSYALSRVTASLLFRVGATDPATFLYFSLLLIAVTAAASYTPVRRATRVDPMAVLRHE